MNKHRKKCDHLKQVRKNVADSLGIDLKQTVCTYEGDCKGTCPKCEYEEKVLSKALLKSTAVVASAALMLTACGKPERVELNLEGDVEVGGYEDEMIDGGMTGPEDFEDTNLVGEDEVLEGELAVLEGDIAYIEE